MKYASAFSVTAEIALYLALALMFKALEPYFLLLTGFLFLVFFCCFFGEKFRRITVPRILIPFLPLTLLLFTELRFELLFFLPAYLYMALTVLLDRFNREHWRYVHVFRALMGAGLVLTLAALVSMPLKALPLIFLGVFFIFGITGIRMIQMGPVRNGRLAFLNFLMVLVPPALIIGAGTLLGFLLSKLGFIMEGLGQLYAWLFTFLTYVMSRIFNKDMIRPSEEQVIETSSAAEEASEAAAASTEAAEHFLPPLPKLEINWHSVFFVLFLIVVAVVLVMIFRKKRIDGGEEKDAASGSFTRYARKRRRREKTTTPVEKVRSSYREYLALLKVRGLRRSPGNTTLDVLHSSLQPEGTQAPDKLRALYIRARYDADVSMDDVKEAEQLLQEIRKNV